MQNAPKYVELREALRRQILDGTLGDGDSIPPERVLAGQHGVSRITARAALSGLAEEGLVKRIRGKGTFVSVRVPVQPRTLTRVVHLVYQPVVANIEHDHFLSELVNGFSRTLAAQGRMLACLCLPGGTGFLEYLEKEGLALDSFSQIVFCGCDLTDAEVRTLRKHRFPFVLIGRPGGEEPVQYIEGDHRAGARAAAEHLLSHGYRRIALVNGPYSLPLCVQRLKGFRDAHRDAGVEAAEELQFDAMGWELAPGRDVADMLLKRKLPCDAILSYGDWATYGLLRRLQERGVRLPDDMPFVVGDMYDWLQRAVGMSMTCVWEPREQLASTALSCLDRQLAEHSAGPLKVTLPVQLTIRDSCGCAPRDGEAEPVDRPR